MAGRKGQRSGGHNKKTAAQLKAEGTWREDRHGKQVDNVAAEGKPIQPNHFSPSQQQLWNELAGFLPDGVVGAKDSTMLVAAVQWYDIYSDTIKQLARDPIDKQLLAVADKSWKNFERLAKEFGATPTARARLRNDPGDNAKKEKTKSDQFLELFKSRSQN